MESREIRLEISDGASQNVLIHPSLGLTPKELELIKQINTRTVYHAGLGGPINRIGYY